MPRLKVLVIQVDNWEAPFRDNVNFLLQPNLEQLHIDLSIGDGKWLGMMQKMHAMCLIQCSEPYMLLKLNGLRYLSLY